MEIKLKNKFRLLKSILYFLNAEFHDKLIREIIIMWSIHSSGIKTF